MMDGQGRSSMRVVVRPGSSSAAHAAAVCIARLLRQAAARRGTCTLALSGGATAASLLDALAKQRLPWPVVSIFQVDERVAPEGSALRNLTALRARLANQAPAGWSGLRPMPVADDLHEAAVAYAARLEAAAGRPAMLDVVHLGLGEDGHTASLVPGDPVLDADADVAATESYQGTRRLTLTLPCLARARHRVWLVTGGAKGDVLSRFLNGDPELPASRLVGLSGACFADAAAAAMLAGS